MVIYLDVLLFTNAVIDGLLLLLSAAILGKRILWWRAVAATGLLTLSTLLIFLPDFGFTLSFFAKTAVCSLAVLLAFGRQRGRLYLRSLAVFTGVTFLYGGIMYGILSVFPEMATYSNGFYYYSISPIWLILLSLILYFGIRVIRYAVRRRSPQAERCGITLTDHSRTVCLTAMVDSGNSLRDVYQHRPVLIVDTNVLNEILPQWQDCRFLLLPVSCVTGSGTLKAYPVEGAAVNQHPVGPVLLALSDEGFDDDYRAIVSPEILEDSSCGIF